MKISSFLKKVDWLSWLGILMILGAYFLNAGGYISSKSLVFLGMNAVGGFCYVIWGYRRKAYAVVAMNSTWFLISIYHIIL